MRSLKAITAAAAVAASLTGTLLTASGAHAAAPAAGSTRVAAPAASQFDCRSYHTNPWGQYVPVYSNISIDSCYYIDANGYTTQSLIPYTNNSGITVEYCAHAINVANGAWAHDYGCAYPTRDQHGTVIGGTYDGAPGYSQYWTASPGTYVVSTGVWVNQRYYGDVQSPRFTIR